MTTWCQCLTRLSRFIRCKISQINDKDRWSAPTGVPYVTINYAISSIVFASQPFRNALIHRSPTRRSTF